MSFGDERETEPAPPMRPRHTAYVVEPSEQGVELRYVSDGRVRCRAWVADGVARNMLEGFEAQMTRAAQLTKDPASAAIYRQLMELFRDVVNGASGGSVPVPEGLDEGFLVALN